MSLMHRLIGLVLPLGEKQAGSTLHEPVSIQLLVVSLLTALCFRSLLWEPQFDKQVIQGARSHDGTIELGLDAKSGDIRMDRHRIDCDFDIRQSIFFCYTSKQIRKQQTRTTKLDPGFQEKNKCGGRGILKTGSAC